jgi:hypothetical protein
MANATVTVKLLNLLYQKQSIDPQRIGNRISRARTLFEISNVLTVTKCS